MPDVPAEEREHDRDIAGVGRFGPYPRGARGPRVHGFEDIHPDLQEILVRMDDDEAKNLKQGLNILVKLEPADFARLRGVLKIINFAYALWRIIKWSVAAFFAGLAGVVLAGEQIQKIWGWCMTALKVLRP
jgi:hypothetical protein